MLEKYKIKDYLGKILATVTLMIFSQTYIILVHLVNKIKDKLFINNKPHYLKYELKNMLYP
jgi:hypothetical protein